MQVNAKKGILTAFQKLLPFIILLIGIVPRALGVINKPLETDEAWTLYFAHAYSFSQLLFHFNIDVHPGGYYALIKLLLKATGGVWMLRLVSSGILQSISLCIFILWATRKKFSRSFIILVSLFVSFSPFFIYYAWQLRMYSLMMFWTTITGILVFEYVFVSPKGRTLMLLIPVLIMSQWTTFSGYLSTLSVVLVVLLEDYSRTKSLKEVLVKQSFWLVCILSGSVVTLLSLFPFRFAAQFSFLGWIPKLNIFGVLSVFPLTVLGLDAQFNPTINISVSNKILISSLGLLVILSLGYYILCFLNKKQYLILIGLSILLSPLLSIGYSIFSAPLSHVPFLYKFVAPVHITIPRFFAPQSVFLYVLLAKMFSDGLRRERRVAGGVYVAGLVLIGLMWLRSYSNIKDTRAFLKRIDISKRAEIARLNLSATVFYPEYSALDTIDPLYNQPFSVVNNIFERSKYFENIVKTYNGHGYLRLSCVRLIGPGNGEEFTLVRTRYQSSFFNQYQTTLTKMLRDNCQKIDSGLFAEEFTCQCYPSDRQY